jgi:hypothetical protein
MISCARRAAPPPGRPAGSWSDQGEAGTMGVDTDALLQRQLDFCWEDEAARARVQTEAHIARDLDRLAHADRGANGALQATVARAFRSEGITLCMRHLRFSLRAAAQSHAGLTADQMEDIEASVRARLGEWIEDRTPYLFARLQSVSPQPCYRLVCEVFAQVMRAIERELKITKARFLLALTPSEEVASPQELARAHILTPEAKDLVPDPELADRLALLDPALSDSYLQVVSDLSHNNRISYLGPVVELRAIVTNAIRKLADDEQIVDWLAQMRELPDDGRHPSRSQRVRFIRYQHTPVANGNQAARALDNLLENMLPGFVANWYDRALSGDPSYAGRDEAVRIFRYADTLLRDLIPGDGRAPEPVGAPEPEDKQPLVIDDSLIQVLQPTWYS